MRMHNRLRIDVRAPHTAVTREFSWLTTMFQGLDRNSAANRGARLR
jgi:hypothetical protein